MRKTNQPAVPGTDAAALLQRHALAGHELLGATGFGPAGGLDSTSSAGHISSVRLPGLRSLVEESWQRSVQFRANPDNPEAPLAMDREELEEYRRQHPLATIMPVIHKLLVLPSHDSGLLVAVGDEVGRLLWVEGDAVMQRRAEGMMFVAGADWSEASVGTSAPGTALALGRSIQISGAEHYKRSVHPWSCTAVPFHDPDSGALLGVVDITGTESAVAPHTLSLVEATVAAAQAQLRGWVPLEHLGRAGPAVPGAALRLLRLELEQVTVEWALEPGERRLDAVGRVAESCLAPAGGRGRRVAAGPALEQPAEGEGRCLARAELVDQLAPGRLVGRLLREHVRPPGLVARPHVPGRLPLPPGGAGLRERLPRNVSGVIPPPPRGGSSGGAGCARR
jgi:hypothetical protein